MDPITLTLLITTLVAGGGFALFKAKPDVFAKIPGVGKLVHGAAAGPRAITLDAAMPDADKNAVIAAVMTAKDPSTLTPLMQKYAAYPWAVYELQYKAWELGGSKGPQPQEPVSGGVSVPTTPSPAAAAAVAANPANAQNLAAQAAAVAQQALQSGGAPAQAPAQVPQNVPAAAASSMAGVPQPPFDLSAAVTAGAWQSDKAYIAAYQSALTYLAVRDNQPSWNPGGVDGAYGPKTGAAVLAFQRAKGLSADGECGKNCATALAAAIGGNQTAGAQQAGATGFYPSAATMQGTAQATLQDHVEGTGGGRGTLSSEGGSAGGRASAQEGVAGARKGPFKRFQPSSEALRDAGLDASGENPSPTAVVHAVQGTRPGGMPFVKIRPQDKVYPRTLATIGTGSDRAGVPALKHLVDINPHLAPTGVIKEFTAGNEVNVPASWAAPIKAKGFAVFGEDGKELG